MVILGKKQRGNNPYKALYGTLVLVVVLLLTQISLVSAFEFDNVKSFDKDVGKYGKITIDNAFGFGGTLQELELKENTDVCASDCSARINIALHNDGSLADEIRFDINQPESYQLYIKTGEKEVDKPTYGETCGENYINGSRNCQYGITGAHKETEEIWGEYSLGEEVSAGDYVLRLEGQKNPIQDIDWVIKSQGRWLEEWAIWGAGSDIFNYWSFNESAGTSAFNSVNGSNNFTLSAGNDDWKAGKLDNALDFNSANGDYGNSSSNGLPLGNFSFSVWLYNDDLVGTDNVFDDRTGGKNTFFYSSDTDTVVYWADSTHVTVSNMTTAEWYHFVFIYNGTGVEVWKNGTLAFRNADTISDNATGNKMWIGSAQKPETFWNGMIDEFGVWDRVLTTSEVAALWNNGAGLRQGVEGATSTSNAPINNYNSSLSEVQFNCTGETTGLITLTNISLFHNGSGTFGLNQTNSTINGNVTSTVTFNSTFAEGNYEWTCEAGSSNGAVSFSSANRTLNIDTTNPIINIVAPVLTRDYNYVGGNESLNWSITEPNLNSCWFDYNSTNQTLTCGDNNFTFILETGNSNLTFYANDSAEHLGSNTTIWDYKVFEINQTFNAVTTEGATETFSINFTKKSSLQVSTVKLIYNGTANSFPYSVTGDEVFSKSTIVIPGTSANANVTFSWNITLDDGSEVSTRLNNQSVSTINVDNCTSFTNLVYNFTQLDEANQSTLDNNTIELQVNLYDTSKTILLINFSQKFTSTNPVQMCLENSILPTVNYSSYVLVKYFANVTAINDSYSIEYYNILNQTIGNTTVPKNINLYSLKESSTTKFRLTFRDSSYVLAPNILVQVHRQYIEDNDFKVVEIPLTDSNGQTILNLVRNDIIYNFIMVNEGGTVVATFNSVTAFCQDFTIGECTIVLAPDPDSEEAYDYDDEFDISLTRPSYSNVTEKISISFVTGDLTPEEVRMEVVRNNDFGNRSVCFNTLTAASGTLSCDASSITDSDQFLFISIYVDGELSKQDTINLNAGTLSFGTSNGAFYAFLLILILICLFMEDKRVLVISLGLGWVAVISLGLMSGNLIGATSAGIWILVSIGIFLWKLNKEDGP